MILRASPGIPSLASRCVALRHGACCAATFCAMLLAACGGGGDVEPTLGEPASTLELPSAGPVHTDTGERRDVDAARAPLSASPSAALSRPTGADEPALWVAYADGRLSLDARAQPLRKVLAAIQARSGVAIAVSQDVADAALTTRFEGVPLIDALLSLLHDQDFVLTFAGGQGGAPMLQAASVHAKGHGG
jgi:hypothetical protein